MSILMWHVDVAAQTCAATMWHHTTHNQLLHDAIKGSTYFNYLFRNITITDGP